MMWGGGGFGGYPMMRGGGGFGGYPGGGYNGDYNDYGPYGRRLLGKAAGDAAAADQKQA
jgi:hypothetical protein